MHGLKSMEEYQLPLPDIASLLAERKFETNTIFYRMKYDPGNGFGGSLAVLGTQDSAELSLFIPRKIQHIDSYIAQFTNTPSNYLASRLDTRTAYFDIVEAASGWLSRFLGRIESLRPHELPNYQVICNDGKTIYGDVLILNKVMHSFSAVCAHQPYTEFAWEFFQLGLLSFQETRSLRIIAVLLASL
jgi:hypothetical protein